MLSRLFLSILFSLGALCALESRCWAQSRQVVIVSIHDYRGLYPSDGPELSALIKSLDPSADIRVVSVAKRDRPGGSRMTNSEIQRAVAQGLEQVAQEFREISLLTLFVHGASVNDGRYRATVTDLGGWSGLGLMSEIRESLAPLRGKFAPGARVVLNSCETLCGDTDQAISRASKLLSFLGIERGSLYGSKTPEVSNYLPRSARPSQRWGSIGRISVGVAMAIAASLADVQSQSSLWNELVSLGSREGTLSVLSLSALYASILGAHTYVAALALEKAQGPLARLFADWRDQLRNRRGEINQGYWVSFKNEAPTAETINKNASLDRLFGSNECELALHPSLADKN